MELKYLSLNDELYRYLCRQSTRASDPLLAHMRRENESYGEDAKCQISQEQGSFLSLLVAAIGARSALEVGTFTGYSSVCIARGLSADGKLICLDQNAEWAAVAQKNWEKAGLAHKIELRLGPALASLRQLKADVQFDFAFIDAAKVEYDSYYELILPQIRPNGLILIDNMLWAGRLTSSLDGDASGQAIFALNRKLAEDSRVEAVLLPIADGLQLCRKRA